MASVAEKEIFCVYGDVRTTFTEDDEDMEFSNLYETRKLFTDKGIATHFPVAVFAWKLLNITEIWKQKKPNFLENIQKPVECFHKNLGKLKKTLNDFVCEEEEERAKPTIIENKGDDAKLMEAFFNDVISSSRKGNPLTRETIEKRIENIPECLEKF